MNENLHSNVTSLAGSYDYFLTSNSTVNKSYKLKWIIPIASLSIVVFMVVITAAYFVVLKYLNRQNRNESSSNKWSTLNNDNTNYGTCDEVISNYSNVESIESIDESRGLNFFRTLIKYLLKPAQFVTNTIYKPNEPRNLFANPFKQATSSYYNSSNSINDKTKLTSTFSSSIKTNSKEASKLRKSNNFLLKRLSNSASLPNSLNNSNSSLNSLSKIVSNESLNIKTALIYKSTNANLILNYSVYLKPEHKLLKVNIISLENLKSVLKVNDSGLNVYVRIELLSPKNARNQLIRKPAKTRLIRNRSNPIYDESFEFEKLDDLFESFQANKDSLSIQNPNDQTKLSSSLSNSNVYRIVFYICNSNIYGRDQLIGQAVHHIQESDLIRHEDEASKVVSSKQLAFPHIHSKKVDLVDARPSDFNLGQLHLSMLFDNQKKSISIHIHKATGLKLPNFILNSSKIPNAFIKIYLLYRGQRVDKKQSAIVYSSQNPVFDEQIEFNLLNLLQIAQPTHNFGFESADIDLNSSFELTYQVYSRLQFVFLIMDWDECEKSQVIGIVDLNSLNFRDRLMNVQNQSKTSVTTFKHLNNFNTSLLSTNEMETDLDESSVPNDDEPDLHNDDHHLNAQHWFNIFSHPNTPILCSLQIKNC